MNVKLEEYKKIDQTFRFNLDKINNLIEKEFIDEAVILMVAILEVFWKDLFKINKDLWFSTSNEIKLIGGGTIEEEIEIRKEIRRYLISIRVYDDFLRIYYIYQGQAQDADIRSIFEGSHTEIGGKISAMSRRGFIRPLFKEDGDTCWEVKD